jgi:hypothetical protein
MTALRDDLAAARRPPAPPALTHRRTVAPAERAAAVEHALHEELRAAAHAEAELGDPYAPAVRAGFLDRLEADARRRALPPERLGLTRAAVTVSIALGSIGLGVVLALVARGLGSAGGTIATIVAWVAILAINVVHARGGRPRG